MALIDPNWPRIGRWALLGTVVMFLWLLAPTAKCSLGAFRDQPLSEATPQSDGSAKSEEPGFFTRWGTAINGCFGIPAILMRSPMGQSTHPSAMQRAQRSWSPSSANLT